MNRRRISGVKWTILAGLLAMTLMPPGALGLTGYRVLAYS
jgi:hypothetical protein